MNKHIHVFDNGVKIHTRHCTDEQLARYALHNVHEPDEEAHFLSAVESIPVNGTFVSVGTAVGYYVILAALLRKDISLHCFEPLPLHVRYLEENLMLNNVPLSRVKVHPIAVTSSHRSVVFEANSFSSRVIPNGRIPTLLGRLKRCCKVLLHMNAGSSQITVRGVPLSGIGHMMSCPQVDLLQMDIQGYEREVLQAFFVSSGSGSKCCSINSFMIGTHGREIHEACASLLNANGYMLKVDQPFSKMQPDGILWAVAATHTG